MTPTAAPQVATQPRTSSWIDEAVEAGGGVVVPPGDATAVVWTRADDPDGLGTLLDVNPQIGWVQLPWAGIEPYLDVIRAHRDRTWTCAKGIYSDPVAEHALAMLLAGFRELPRLSTLTTWTGDAGRNLLGAKVVIVGGGGIGGVLVEMLGPFRCDITVVRRTPVAMEGVNRVVSPDHLDEALDGADALVLAIPLVPETRGMIGARELALLAPGAWVINVARGEHIDTDALVVALDSDHLGGAGLDVTDPEPLPDGHPLWGRSNVIITPHTANTAAMAKPLLGRRIRENVAQYGQGVELTGRIDPDLGY